jgi:hypothetical protein
MHCWIKRGRVLAACMTVAVLGTGTALAAGRGWSVQPGPSAGLHEAQFVGVSCPAAKSCIAVGVSLDSHAFHGVLAERWLGKSWKQQSVPLPAGSKAAQLFDVSCASIKRCTATGRYTSATGLLLPLAERFNGSKWTIQRTPVPAGTVRDTLRGVSCPTANSCFAVGAAKTRTGAFQTFIERWNGRSWSIAKAPSPAGSLSSELITVSCTSPRACMTVGDFIDPHGVVQSSAERWDGSHWQLSTVVNPAGVTRSQLTGVWCTATSQCEAVGYYTAPSTGGFTAGLAEAWNGSSWSTQAVPGPSGAKQVVPLDVACRSASDCTAVGQTLNQKGASTTLVEHWNGTNWSPQATARPASATGSLFNAIACATTGGCTAAGWYGTKRGAQLPLAERHS